MNTNYTEWLSGENYGNRAILEKGIIGTLHQPFILQNIRFSVGRQCAESIQLGKDNLFSSIDRSIIGVLAQGKCMSANQLFAYLMARSEYISQKALYKRLCSLHECGLIEYLNICEKKNENDSENGENEEESGEWLRMYQLSDLTYSLCPLMNIPADSPDNRNLIYKMNRGIFRYIIKSALANGIVLNFLTYYDKVLGFCIEKLYNMMLGEPLEIPLYIETEREKYMFFLSNNLTIQSDLACCLRYYEETHQKVRFVFVVSTVQEMSTLKEEVLAMADNGLKIGLSVISNWFGEKKGDIILLN
ncbi:MAG: hypothetical protein SOZ48_11020 [Eubacterium sp.]|nr:hypothetical protein [Eubacterium sp.]